MCALAPELDSETAEALLDLVRRHRVVWEVYPERQVFDREVRQIGYSIEIFARHDRPVHEPMPGCDECVRAYAALRKIARFALPRGEHATYYALKGFDRTMTYPNPVHGEGLVRLTIKLLHRHGYARPPDACELACLREIETRLSALGARAIRRSLGS